MQSSEFPVELVLLVVSVPALFGLIMLAGGLWNFRLPEGRALALAGLVVILIAEIGWASRLSPSYVYMIIAGGCAWGAFTAYLPIRFHLEGTYLRPQLFGRSYPSLGERLLGSKDLAASRRIGWWIGVLIFAGLALLFVVRAIQSIGKSWGG